jgi:hypothetical protein
MHKSQKGNIYWEEVAAITAQTIQSVLQAMQMFDISASFQHSRNISSYFLNVDQPLQTNSNGVAISYIPGISYSLNKRWQLELTMPNLATVSYAKVKTIDSKLPPNASPQKANIFSANVNLNSSLLNNFGIGFEFLLGK